MRKINIAQRSPDYKDLTGPNGTEDNLGGIVAGYYAPKRWFNVIQDTVLDLDTYDEATDELDDLALITATHTFLTGYGFLKMYLTAGTGEVKYSSQGERDGRSVKPVATFLYPGMKSDALGFQRKAKNDQFIYLFIMSDKKRLQFGTADLAADFFVEATTAKMESGVRGSMCTVSIPVASGAALYTGTITLKP